MYSYVEVVVEVVVIVIQPVEQSLKVETDMK